MAKFIGKEREHRIVVERAIGIPLPSSVEVHHMDGDDMNNRNDNLVVCQDHQYHMLLHRRTVAYDACGNANYRKCIYCKQWDDPANMKLSYANTIKQYRAWHLQCNRDSQNALRDRTRV